MVWPPTPPTYRGYYVGTAARRLIGGNHHDKNWRKVSDALHNASWSIGSELVSAGGGVTPTATVMRLSTAGGEVDISANPQIVASPEDGRLLLLQGTSDVNYVTLQDGDGLHLHGEARLLNHDELLLMWDEGDSQWEEITRNFPSSEKAWGLTSPAGGGGTSYIGGFYAFGTGNSDFTSTESFGTANAAYGAHLFVVLGDTAVDEITITITGTTITDAGTRVDPDTEVITIPVSSVAGFYVETSKKWVGTVAIDHTSGTAKVCNWGWAKYWDNNNNDFVVTGFEATFTGGANDSAPNISVRHHKTTGWTYGASAPVPPAALADMQTDYNTEFQIKDGEPGAWKRSNLFQVVTGAGSEGTIIELVTNFGRTFEIGNFMLRMRTR